MGNLCSGETKTNADFRPYLPVSTKEPPINGSRSSAVGLKFQDELPVVQAVPRMYCRESPKLSIVGDSMTIQMEDLKISCVDNATANWCKVQPSSKLSNKLAILRSLNHPNIVRFLFTLNANNFQHVAFEPVKKSLSAHVSSLHNYRDVVWQLADAVEYLQARRIVHMSLTPENIFVIKDNRRPVIKIANFGSAIKLKGEFVKVPCDAPKHAIFSAPEILDGIGVYLESDLFSLGNVIFFVYSKGCDLVQSKNVSSIAAQREVDSNSVDILCADLIFRLVMNNPNDRLKADQMKLHPFFWDAEKTVNFIIEVNKLIEAGDANFKKFLFINSKNALNGRDDWPAFVEKAVMDELNDNRKDFLKRTGRQDYSTGKKNIVSLIQVMRHVAVHSQNSSLVREKMGLCHEDFIKFWLEKFPNLLQHMYNAKVLFEQKAEEPTKRTRASKSKKQRRQLNIAKSP